MSLTPVFVRATKRTTWVPNVDLGGRDRVRSTFCTPMYEP
jgi:hypothetical protein